MTATKRCWITGSKNKYTEYEYILFMNRLRIICKLLYMDFQWNLIPK